MSYCGSIVCVVPIIGLISLEVHKEEYDNDDDEGIEKWRHLYRSSESLKTFIVFLHTKENYSPITKTNIPCLMIGRYFDLFIAC